MLVDSPISKRPNLYIARRVPEVIVVDIYKIYTFMSYIVYDERYNTSLVFRNVSPNPTLRVF